MESIYLDNAATTRPHEEVVEAMGRAMREGFGNPSSLHSLGLKAEKAVREASETIEQAIGGGSWRAVFTSGGTEADASAVLGTVPRGKRNGMVTTSVEHPAVIESCKHVESLGGKLAMVPAGETGVVDPEKVIEVVDDQSALVSVVHVAPEIGTVQPVAEIAARSKEKSRRCLVHVDAVQALAQLQALDYPNQVDMVSISSHKIHGPMGIGALLLRPNVRPRPLVFGGDQQGGLRPGTLNVPGIVGFGAAAKILMEKRVQGADRMKDLSEQLLRAVAGGLEGVRALGDQAKRAPGILVLAIMGVKSEVLLHVLESRGLFASAASACHSTRTDPPQAVKDAGLKSDEGVLRLSLSFDTTQIEIDSAISIIIDSVGSVRSGRVESN